MLLKKEIVVAWLAMTWMTTTGSTETKLLQKKKETKIIIMDTILLSVDDERCEQQKQNLNFHRMIE